jgi:hypothetical protein
MAEERETALAHRGSENKFPRSRMAGQRMFDTTVKPAIETRPAIFQMLA